MERDFLSFDITYWKKTNHVKVKKSANTDSEEETIRVNYIYVCKKLPGADQQCQLHYADTIE